MKKIISILLSMVMVLSLVACGVGGEKVPNINEQINNVKTISEYSQEIPVNNMDTIKFGSYYQNNENNKESVEWIVLDKQNGKALLCSKYILDYKTISNEELNSYNNSNLRVWLNNDFYNNIFSEKEKGYICSEGDKVLLLDKMQSDKYFGSQIQDGSHWYNYKRATKGTEYAKNIEKDGNKLYVYNGNNETVVGNSGYIITDNDMIVHIDYEGAIPLLGGDNGIRPIIWVKCDGITNENNDNNISLENQKPETTKQVIESNKEELSMQINNALVINDIDKRKDIEKWESVKFGKYYINDSNIKDDIEWLVLEKNGNEALLLSKYLLDEYWFDKYLEDCLYDTSELRTWLNVNFYKEAFNENEKIIIRQNKVNFADFKFSLRDPKKQEIKKGKDIEDKVFILSLDEYKKYFNLKISDTKNEVDASILTKPTKYLNYKNDNVNSYWLRDSGLDYDYIMTVENYDFPDKDDEAHICTGSFHDDIEGVRPAIWVNIDAMNYVAETSNNNIRDIIGGEANIEGAEVIQNEDGSITIGGALQYNKKNDKLLKDYNEYKQNPDDYMVKFDSDGNLWVRRWVSECVQLIYDYTILYVDGKIDSYITDFEKVGSASYDFHWMKNGNKIDESEFRQIENQFNNMADQYSSIY